MQIGLGLSITAQLRFGSSLSSYAVNDFDPSLVFDFEQSYYRTGGTDSTLSNSITHAATSNATMTGSDGNIKWRPHNLQTYSNDFSNGAWSTVFWVKSQDVDGNWSFTSNAASRTINFTATTSVGNSHTVGIEAKAGTLDWVAIRSLNFASDDYHWFDLTNGAVGAGGTYPQTITDLGDGWYLCEIEIDTSVDNEGSPRIYGGSADETTAAGQFYLRNGRYYRSDLGGMVNNSATGNSYVPTTSSAVYLPRVGHHIYNGDAWANEGVLHESEARTNLEDYSDMSSGVTLVGSATLTPNNASGPAGENTAATLTTNNTTSQQGFATNQAFSGSTNHTFSIFAKANGVNYIQLIASSAVFGVDVWGNFDLATGVAGTMGTSVLNYGIEDWGDGWYRVFITGLAYGSSGGGGPYMVNTATTARGGSVTGNGTSGLLLFGYQFEAGSTPSSYIPTSGSTVTRAAETLTVPSANLPWPTPVETTGTELVTNGDFATNDFTSWVVANDPNATASSGGANIGKLSGDAAQISQDISVTSGKIYQISFDITSVTGPALIQLRDGTGGLWQETTSAPTSVVVYYTETTTILGLNIRSRTDGVRITVDNISVKEINPLSVSIQMDGRMTFSEDNSNPFNPGFFLWELNSSNRIRNINRTDGTYSGAVQFSQIANGLADYAAEGTGINGSYSPNTNVPFNVASRHGSTFINGAVDGTALTADTTPIALPDLSSTDLDLGYDFMGTIGKFRVWSDDLTDTGIATASAPSTEPSLQLTFDGSSTSSFTVLDWSE